MKCPYCGIENQSGENFCEYCGSPMDLFSTTTIERESINTRSLIPGSSLQAGRYVIKKILGQGGMGSVFLATDTRLANKMVVIKALISDDSDPATRQQDVRNFKQEVETLAHLDHPLIPGVTDHFQEGSRYCMVQECVEGESLQAHMERTNQPMQEAVALRYASEVLDILDYLADQVPPIVHRDIKPANIITGAKDGRAHLVDFGIARKDIPSNAQRKQTMALGTPGYAPPEQYRGNADPRSDLYALAATLHHLVTNRDPSEHGLFHYPPVRQLNPHLSPEIEAVLSHALRPEVNQRYQSAKAMKHDIDTILLGYLGTPGNSRSYRLADSLPGGESPEPMRASQPIQVQQQLQVYPVLQPVNQSPITPYEPRDRYAGTGYQPRRVNVGLHFLLFVLAISLMAVAVFLALDYVYSF
jgi:eukaryotic-like serine/threonine-protein kinase